MDWDVTFVRPLPDDGLHVELRSGRAGVFDLTPYLDDGVFRELRDVGYFNRVGVVLGAVTWPHEQDIAPETLLAGLQPITKAPAPDSPRSPVSVQGD